MRKAKGARTKKVKFIEVSTDTETTILTLARALKIYLEETKNGDRYFTGETKASLTRSITKCKDLIAAMEKNVKVSKRQLDLAIDIARDLFVNNTEKFRIKTGVSMEDTFLKIQLVQAKTIEKVTVSSCNLNSVYKDKAFKLCRSVDKFYSQIFKILDVTTDK